MRNQIYKEVDLFLFHRNVFIAMGIIGKNTKRKKLIKRLSKFDFSNFFVIVSEFVINSSLCFPMRFRVVISNLFFS